MSEQYFPRFTQTELDNLFSVKSAEDIKREALAEMIDEDRMRREMDAQDQMQEANRDDRHSQNPHMELP